MYVIVETGGKQYRIAKNDIFEVERLGAQAGKVLRLDKVLLYSDGKRFEVGKPYLKDVKVNCEVLKETKGPKVISYTYKKRKGSKTKIGHRQKLVKLKVKEIGIG